MHQKIKSLAAEVESRSDRIIALVEKIRPLRANAKPEDVPFALGRLNR
jgi:hypothetical protein